MPWTYEQSTGNLYHDGKIVGQGYSGMPPHKNQPDAESIKDIGPIPRGRYSIGPAFQHQSKGSSVMRLTPQGHAAWGRSGFLIHGDSKKHPGRASEGCIVLGSSFRNEIAGSHDTVLEVIR